MAANATTDKELSVAEQYARDGVVCVREVFDADFIASLVPIAMDMRSNPQDYNLLPTITHPRFMARTDDQMRKLVFNSRLGEVAAEVLGSKQVRFFFDELFTKEPHCDRPTMWHNDRAGWPATGEMIPSIWIPLTPVTRETCLEGMAGSHAHDTLYWLFSPNGRKMIKPDDRPLHPNAEVLRGEDGIEILGWEMRPGDALFIHPWALHYAAGNPTENWRLAISIRVFGDDVRWDPRPECLNFAGVSFDEMVPGEKPAGDNFPLLWDDGPVSNPGSKYPRGYATTWSKDAYARLRNEALEKTGFKNLLKDGGGASVGSLEKIRSDIKALRERQRSGAG